MTTAREVLDRCAELDRVHRRRRPQLERVYLSREHASANAVAGRWMEQAGLRTWQDAAGNQCGRREGATPGLPALLRRLPPRHRARRRLVRRDARRRDGDRGRRAAARPRRCRSPWR